MSATDASRRSEKAARASEARDAAPHDEAFRLSASPAHLLRRAQQYASGIFQQAGLSGVTLRQSVVLAAIAEEEGRSQAELVKATGVDRSTLADMIGRMEKKGLVGRVRSAGDARAKAVSLTDEGRAKLQQAMPAMRAVDDALSDALPKHRRAAFRDLLSVLATAADESEFFETDERKTKKPAKAEGKRRKKRRKRK
jgi:DNA-binding MarR family transcriptional regulator